MASGPTIEDRFAQYGPNYRYFVAFAGMLGVMSVVLSVTIVNVAVPSVMGAYGIGLDLAQWMATAFIATMTISQLLNSWLVSAFGQRLTFLLVIVVFFIGTAIAAASPTYDFIIVGRVLQGFSAGVSQPLVMVLLFQVFPENRRGLAMGLYGMAIMLAPGIGPFIGGLAIDTFSWRYIFYIPLPFSAAAASPGRIPDARPDRVAPVAAVRLVGDHRSRHRADQPALRHGGRATFRMDIRSDHDAHGNRNCGVRHLCVFAVARKIAPIGHEPLHQPGIHSRRPGRRRLRIRQYGVELCHPGVRTDGQRLFGHQSRVGPDPAGLVLMALFPVSGRFADQVPAHYPIMIGLLCFALGTALMTTTNINTTFWTVAIFTMIGRFGMGLIMPPLVSSAMRTLRSDQLNRGSGALNFMRQLGGSIGINSLVVLISQRTQFHSDALTATQTPANPVSREFLDAVEHLLDESGVPAAVHQPGALHYLGNVIEAQATTLGFQDGFSFISIVFVCALIPVWILKRAGQVKNV